MNASNSSIFLQRCTLLRRLARRVMYGGVVVATAAALVGGSESAHANGAVTASPATAAATRPCDAGGYNPCNWDAIQIMNLIAHPQADTVVVSSHRGLHALVNGSYATIPENSPDAIDATARAGLPEVELDVKLSKDGTPVISHDTTVGRETNFSQDLSTLHSCTSNECFDPFADPNDQTNAARNPALDTVGDNTLNGFRSYVFLRDSVSLQVRDGTIFHLPSLKQMLQNMTFRKEQMVLALDIRTPDIARAALPILASTIDSMGRSYLADTLFKVPFIATPSAAAVQQMFPQYRNQVNYQPVFNTGDACGPITNDACSGFGGATSEAGGESNLVAALNDVEQNSGVKVPAVEVQLKKNGGNMQQLLDDVRHYPGSAQRRSVTVFSPYQDIDPAQHGLDPSKAPYFFKTNGYCCNTLPDFYFNSTPASSGAFPPDTTDQRVDLSFLTSEVFNGVTTDNAATIAAQIDTTRRDLPNEPPAASAPVSSRSCDVYDFYGTPCAEAVSTTRALYANYAGPLYQAQRTSDKATKDIGLLAAGGYADAASQDSFCANTSCVITKIYDQSPEHNDLTVEGAGGAGVADHGADASALPVMIAGHKVYGVDVTGQVGYRDNNTDGTARNGHPEGMYMVASGTHVNDGCCFDFGNVEANNQDTGNGHMDAVNLGTKCYFPPCTGSGPWVEADLENGLFSGGNGSNLANKGNGSNFVTALLKNDGQTTYALKGGDSQSGGLSTWYSGALPNLGGYTPMQQEGGIVLGTGGDNSNASIGSFFEGVMTAGYPSDAADNAVQANIVSAGYAGSSGSSGPSGGSGAAAAATAGPAVAHEGYSSVYTVDASNNHLQETYLPAIGQPWATQDLSGNYGTPAVAPGTEPVALTHDGYTSVYTVDASNGHLQETFLPAIGQGWSTQDLSANYGTPQTGVTPTAVVHDGYTSVYTVDASNGHLQETFLPALGQGWATQDLSANYGTPQVLAGTSSVAVYHSGYTSVYTIDANHDLQETYLPAIGQRWASQDLSANYGTPQSTVTPTAVVHAGYTSVYTVDQSNNDLQETYLPAIGQRWASQDLSANYGTPPVAAGTQPVALFHTGYTSVYTVDTASDHLQETYLPAIGQSWTTQDLSAKYGTPVTTRTPIVLLHADTSGALTWTSVYTFNQFDNHLQETYLSAIGSSWITQDLSAKFGTPARNGTDLPTAGWSAIHDGYTSVYTVDASNGHLQETYLPAMNQPWSTQDLSANYGTPAVRGGVAPVTVTHDGYTSVFTVDQSNNHLQETFLPAIGQGWSTQDLSANYGTAATTVAPTVAVHNGYTSVYTVDASNGHLQETYLSAIGQPWVVQDLSANYGTPSVSANTSPSAIVHSNYTSVYTVDASNNDVQETYLPSVGAPWATQDLSAKYGTPTTNVSPAALAHDGYTSVYTVDSSDSHLQETFLPAIGDPWTSQDLSTNYGAPSVASGKPPVALYHTGYASVYTVNASNGNLQETYLPSIGSPWTSQDLSAKYGTPPPNQAPSALLHYDTSGGLTFTSVFTVNASDQHLQETYLPAINQPWTTQDLSAKYGTPPV